MTKLDFLFTAANQKENGKANNRKQNANNPNDITGSLKYSSRSEII